MRWATSTSPGTDSTHRTRSSTSVTSRDTRSIGPWAIAPATAEATCIASGARSGASRDGTHGVGDLLEGTDEFHVLQFVEVMLCPAEGRHEGRRRVVRHDLDDPALPVEEGGFHATA